MFVSRFYTLSLGCLVNVTPLDKPGLAYREYYFDERGRFLDFHSQAGDYETSTANHAYFLFPRHQYPSFQLLADGSIAVTLASGQTALVSGAEPRILSFPGNSFSEPAGNGLGSGDFLSLQRFPGLVLDAGWKVGTYAYYGRAGSSTFRDAQGAECRVGNGELFDYDHILYSEPTFLFETDEKLAAFLAGRCPNLHWIQ